VQHDGRHEQKQGSDEEHVARAQKLLERGPDEEGLPRTGEEMIRQSRETKVYTGWGR